MIGHTLTAAGDGGGDLLAADDPPRAAAADDQLRDARSGAAGGLRAERGARGAVAHAISNSFGFGGQNVCLVLGAPG